MIDLVARRWLFYVLSAAIALPGLVSLALPGGLRPGIDFINTAATLRSERPDDGSPVCSLSASMRVRAPELVADHYSSALPACSPAQSVAAVLVLLR